jgi:hypothetical protein
MGRLVSAASTGTSAVRNVSALVLVLAIVAISLGVGACGSSGQPGAGAGCRVGAAVGRLPEGKTLPSCTADEPHGSAYNYPCRHAGQHTQDFYLIYLTKAVLYGKPSGTWHRAPANARFAMLRSELDC